MLNNPAFFHWDAVPGLNVIAGYASYNAKALTNALLVIIIKCINTTLKVSIYSKAWKVTNYNIKL